MMPVMVAALLVMSDVERGELEVMAAATSLAVRRVRQARALLLAADGVANAEIARRVAVKADTVRRWRKRFEVERVAGVGRVAPGRGRKASIPAETIAAIVSGAALETVAGDGS